MFAISGTIKGTKPVLRLYCDKTRLTDSYLSWIWSLWWTLWLMASGLWPSWTLRLQTPAPHCLIINRCILISIFILLYPVLNILLQIFLKWTPVRNSGGKIVTKMSRGQSSCSTLVHLYIVPLYTITSFVLTNIYYYKPRRDFVDNHQGRTQESVRGRGAGSKFSFLPICPAPCICLHNNIFFLS